jgi:hypothetical protein
LRIVTDVDRLTKVTILMKIEGSDWDLVLVISHLNRDQEEGQFEYKDWNSIFASNSIVNQQNDHISWISSDVPQKLWALSRNDSISTSCALKSHDQICPISGKPLIWVLKISHLTRKQQKDTFGIKNKRSMLSQISIRSHRNHQNKQITTLHKQALKSHETYIVRSQIPSSSFKSDDQFHEIWGNSLTSVLDISHSDLIDHSRKFRSPFT